MAATGCSSYTCDYPFIEQSALPSLGNWYDFLSYPQNYYIPEYDVKQATKTMSMNALPKPLPMKAPPKPKPTPPPLRRIIRFYNRDAPHYSFTNFSAYPVQFQGRVYPTSEHLFQAMKFMRTRPDMAEYIRTSSPRPRQAFSFARACQAFTRVDWHDIKIRKMDLVLELKFTQHSALRRELLDTGDAELVEDSPKDSFWGIGSDGTSGCNELGKALMRLRARFLAAAGPSNQGPRSKFR